MNVKFYSVKLKSTYNDLEVKDNLALYWILETSELYKGEQLFGTGAFATQAAAGLLSAEDKAKLDALVAASEKSNLSAVDKTIVITETADGKAIGVAVSAQEGNALVAVEDGLFVPVAKEIAIPEYAIEKQETAEDGYATSYKLKKTVNGEVSYVGDTINIAKDMVLQGATLEVVTAENVPYDGAKVGDPYIDMVFNDAAGTHIYIPVSGLVDTIKAGQGVSVVDNTVSVKLSAVDGNILTIADDGGLFASVPGCSFTPVEKAQLAVIPMVYATKDEVDEKITRALDSNQMVWVELNAVSGVARIGNKYYDTIPSALKAAKAGDTINLMAGSYSDIEFTDATAANLTIVGDEGVYVKKIRLINTTNYGAPDNLTLKNITFNGEGITASKDKINNLSVIGCTFTDGAVIHVGDCTTNGLLVKNCKFNATNSGVNAKEKTAILVQGTSKNVVIIDNNIVSSEHNAIQVVGASGSILIDSNIIDSTGSRAMRMTTKDGAILAIMNNIITNANTNPAEAEENAGEIIKITGSVVDGAIANNTYNGNELVFNAGIGQVI